MNTAKHILKALNERMQACLLELHPKKTRIVYCKDKDRTKEYTLTEFDFLGYTLKGVFIKCKNGCNINIIAEWINPIVRGWINYFSIGGKIMNIQVVKINNDEKGILQKLLELYCYEWSQYNKLDVNQLGSYEFALLDCWTKENHYPFFIRVDGKLAGFVLVDKDFAVRKDYDFAISEFFVMHKYRTSGVGRYAAKTIFDMLHGKWEIMCHPNNINSIYFWNKIIDEYKNGKFEFIESCKEVVYQDGTFADFFFFEN